MKTNVFRIVTVAAVCACVMGSATVASAQGNRMHGLQAQMSRLQEAKREAYAHHHMAQVHQLQRLINRLQIRIDNRM